jgi:hypothetical protein
MYAAGLRMGKLFARFLGLLDHRVEVTANTNSTGPAR